MRLRPQTELRPQKDPEVEIFLQKSVILRQKVTILQHEVVILCKKKSGFSKFLTLSGFNVQVL